MSGSRSKESGKATEYTGSTIGFKFHANDEELEELIQTDKAAGLSERIQENVEENKSSAENLDLSKLDLEKNEPVGDAVRDHWSLLGRRAGSVDSNYESPFSNPIETWKKLNELKEKITKTVEEKISDLKIDKNVLSKSSRNSLLNSKENSSVSDSEDNSESSKVSEYWKDAEEVNSSPKKIFNGNEESLSSILETTVESVKLEIKNLEAKSELRNRKYSKNMSEINEINDIKIATARSELQTTNEDNQLEEIESGVEADEQLNSDLESSHVPPASTLKLGRRLSYSETPPPGENQEMVNEEWYSVALSRAWAAALFIGCIFFFISPMPDFLKGFMVCFIMIKIWKIIKNHTFISDERLATQPFQIPDYKSMPPLKVPLSRPVKGVWVNEYEKDAYDPDYYSVTHTVPAYLELDNNILKLSRPKGKIQRRATYDEPDYKLPFISHKVYNISGCNVYLMPEGLTRKRLFSKKYPIVIYLKPDSLISEKRTGKGKDNEDRDSNEATDGEEKVMSSESANRSTLYIFARCDRQKEEWYRKLLAASRMSSTPTKKSFKMNDLLDEKDTSDDSSTKEASTPFETSFFDNDEAQTEEYLRYMAKFVGDEYHQEIKYTKPRSSWYRKLKSKKRDTHGLEVENFQSRSTTNDVANRKSRHSKTSEFGENYEDENEDLAQAFLQVQWLNAFINRILFDIFRSPYWLQKVHEKLERKFNSIRLPFYVENIEIIEMDLGKTGPTFHRVSPPYIDDRGLWFDMDVTFDGHIRLTIQTHLNLIKLQKGVEEQEELFASDKPSKGKKKRKDSEYCNSHKDSKKKHKETKETSSETKTKKSHHVKSAPTQSIHDSDHESVDEVELRDEVAQLAAIVVEESLAEENSKEKIHELNGKTVKKKKFKSPIYDSDVEDSAESSDDSQEEEEEENFLPLPQTDSQEKQDGPPAPRRYPKNRRSSKRFFRVFENMAQNKYFRSMAQSKYIQKAIAGVSATKLRLTIELKSLTGILSVNVPPPPTDRFWYGFREMPNLVFSANPKIGGKALRFVHIKNYIQKKILHELKKVMVTPNMIDFELPTSAPARSSSSLPTELPDLDDQEATPSE